ncbi:MAG: glycosyltransferase family 2 protein [Candidatus Bathyarchaeia archaeon]
MENDRVRDVTRPKVAIIILNWNGWRDTIECLESLRQLTYQNYQVVIVDNGSTDESLSRLTDWLDTNKQAGWSVSEDIFAATRQYASFEHVYSGIVSSRAGNVPVTLLESGHNLGYAGGNNIGLAWAVAQGCKYTLILNNDVKVDPRLLDNLVDVAGETGASVVGALVRDFNGKHLLFVQSFYPAMLFLSERQSRMPHNRWWPTHQVNGSAMLLSRELLLERWRTFGYFLDPSLFLYCEELELALWCRRTGHKCVMAGEAVVYHKLGASSRGARQQQFYYLTRNRVLLARRYLAFPLKLLFMVIYPFWRIFRAAMYAVRGRREIARAIILGLLDGYQGRTGQWHIR